MSVTTRIAHSGILRRPVTSCLLAAIALYRVSLGLYIGGHCRYAPSCSAYAQIALRRFGAFAGCRLIVGRLLRCHPWGACGADPVPSELVPCSRAQRDGL